MPILRYLRKVQFIDHLIRKKATGNQVEFAKKIRLSRSMLNEYLNEMKEMGFPIKYNRSRNTYYYEKEGKMVDSLFEDEISKDEMKNYTGGYEYSLYSWWTAFS